MANSDGRNLTYELKRYERGYIGKCVEIPSIMAQAKTREKLNMILDSMTAEYFRIVKKRSISESQQYTNDNIIIERRPIP
jgi:predicted RNase H-like HicB family nuclease